MAPKTLLLLSLAIAVVAGCGGSGDDPSTTTTAPPVATQTQPPAAERNLVNVASLLGKQLAGEPDCRFDDRFEAVGASAYDGSLGLGVVCGPNSVGQLLNLRRTTGANRIKVQNLSCSTTQTGVVCRVAPDAAVGMYFTGPDETIARRRLQRLAAVVRALPRGASPASGAAPAR